MAESPASGDLNAGKTVTYTLTMSEVVTVNTTGGSPTLTLNDGGTATYTGGTGSSALTFGYTVLAGQNTPDLMVSAVDLNGATLLDGAGNAANLSLTGLTQGSPQIDTTSPMVSSVTGSAGDYNAGKALMLTLNMSEAVTVTGTPTLTLNDGGTATYTAGSGTTTLTFNYTVASGQNAAALGVTAVSGTIADLAGNTLSTANLPETFTGLSIDTTTPSVTSVVASGTGITAGAGDLAAGSVVTLTVNLSEVVAVAGGTPTLTLNDGGTATYAGGSGTSALTFGYTVANGQNTPALAVTAVNLNGATVQDVAGNSASLSLSGLAQTGPKIDTTRPVVTASSVMLPQNDIVAASSLFSASDLDGDPITQYSFYDDLRTASSGEFLLNGVAQPKGTYQPLFVSASQLSQVTFEAGAGGTADDLYIAAYDGTVASNIAHLQVSAATPPAPVVTASNVTLPQSDIVAASSLFSATNPAGATPITSYAFYDDLRTASSGEFLLNGVAQPKGTYQPLVVSASQLSQVTFEAGAGGTADDLYIATYDGTVASNIAHLQVSAATPPAPVVTASNVTLPQSDIVAASSLFSATNPAGATPITSYAFYDDLRTASSGEFLLNGVAQPKGTYQPLVVSASQLSQVTFEAGAGGTADDLYIATYDGTVASNIAHLQVSAATPPAPVVTASNVTLPQSDIVAASSLFSATNPAGATPITSYAFYDDSRTASSGEFLLNGVAQPKGTYQPLVVSASQLSQVTFEAGSGGTEDDLYIAAYDGSAASNIAHLQVSAAAPPAPVVTVANVTLPQSDIVAVSSSVFRDQSRRRLADHPVFVLRRFANRKQRRVPAQRRGAAEGHLPAVGRERVPAVAGHVRGGRRRN